MELDGTSLVEVKETPKRIFKNQQQYLKIYDSVTKDNIRNYKDVCTIVNIMELDGTSLVEVKKTIKHIRKTQ